MQLFDYTFFRLYRFYSRIKNADEQSMAIGVLSLIQSLTLSNLMFLIRTFYKFQVPPPWTSIPVIVTFLILNWIRYGNKFDIKKLEIQWLDEEKKKKVLHDILIGLYLAISALVPITDAVITRHFMSNT